MKRHSIEYIKNGFIKKGWCPLFKEYKNVHQLLKCICPNGHLVFITWHEFSRGGGCSKCVNIKLKKDFDVIKKEFKKRNYVLLTKEKEYKNCYTKLKYVCNNGHKCSIIWNSFQQGKGCSICANKNVAEKLRKDFDIIVKSFEKCDYILLTTKEEYKNSHQKLDYVCPKGHQHSIRWYSWKAGNKCPECAGVLKKTIESIILEFSKENYTVISTVYNNAHSKLKCICPKGHICYISWSKWSRGQRCRKCSHTISKWELVVKKFVDFLDIFYISNDKIQIMNPNTGCNLELDIWFPDLNKAIECNGLYWHSKPDRKECDKIKKQLCRDQGIDLLVITDKEWNKNIDKVKEKIKNFCVEKKMIKLKEKDRHVKK